MTNEEKLNRIDELEKKRFYLAMKDFWSAEDYQQDRKWWMEIHDLERQIEVTKSGLSV